MANNDFIVNVIAGLNKQLSKRAINNDLKTLDNTMYVKVLAKLSTSLARRQLNKQLKELNNLYVQIGANVKIDKSAKNKLQQNIKMLQQSLSDLEVGLKVSKGQQAKINADILAIRKSAQQKAERTPISFNLEVKKSKLISDIEYLGKRYSKLFSNTAASAKYEKIMSNAFAVSDRGQLSNTRAELAAFTSELKANGLAVKSTGDKWKSLIERSKELFSAASIIRVVFSQVRQSVSTFLELDTAMTDLYKVQNDITSRDQFSGLLSKWNKLAQDLSVTTKSLINGASEWSKIGFNLDMSEQLAQITAMFEKTAEISNEQASQTLISGAQAFTEIDDLGEDDYVERVEAIGNKINAIGNKYAISSEGIAEALQNSSASLKMANNDLDESIALITAGNKIFQSPEEMGNTLKVVSARLRGQKGELEALNEDTEGMIEGVSKVQTQILNLTGNKVNIFEDDNETLKSTYEIMLEVGKELDKLSDKDQADLLEIMFGKQRMSAGASVLLNYEELEKVKNDSMNAANSMAEEYAKYLESAEAHITTFQEKLIETYSLMSGDTVKFAADAGSAILDLVNKTDLLRHSLLAVASIQVGKGITTIGATLSSTAKEMNTLGRALEKVRDLPLDSVLRDEELANLGEATKGLTEKNLKLLLSQKQLEYEDRISILTTQELTREEAAAKLEKMGLTTATKAQSAANVTEAATTTTLKGAMTSLKASILGVGASIKAAFLSNPIGWVLMGVSTAVSLVSTGISNYNQKLEETRQKNIENATSASESANSLKDLYIKYTRLASIQDRTTTQENQFQTAVENITKALGDKAEALSGLKAGTDEYTESLKKATQAELEGQYATAKIGAKAAEDDLKDKTYSSFDGSKITIQQNERMTGVEEHMAALNAVKDILSDYEDMDIVGSETVLTWKPIDWDTDHENMDAVVDYYNALLKARNKLVTSEDADFLMSSDIYEDINTTINDLSDSVEEYTKKQYEALKLEYMWQNGIPATEEEFVEMEQSILAASSAGEAFQNILKGYLTEDFSSLSGGIDEVGNALDDVKTKAEETVITSPFSLTEDQSKSIDDFQTKVKTLGDTLSALQSGDSVDMTDLIQEFPTLANESENLEEAIRSLIYDSLTELYSLLGQDVPDSLKDSLQSIADEASGMTVPLDVAFSAIQKSYDAMTEFKSALSDKGLTDSVLNTVAGLSGELNNLVAGFYAGTVSADQLYSALTDHYNTDLQNYGNALIAKNEMSEDFYNSVGLNSAELVNSFMNDYGIDLSNCRNYNEAKIEIERQTLQTIGSMWSKYYNAQSMAFTKEGNALAERALLDGDPNARKLLDKIMEQSSAYEEAMNALNDVVYDGISANFKGISTNLNNAANSASSAADKVKEAFSKTIDFIQNGIKRWESAIQSLERVATNTYNNLTKRQKAYTDEIKGTEFGIELLKKDYEYYMAAANAVGLDADTISKIQGGSSEIANITDEDLSEKISQYDELYQKAQDCLDQIEELKVKLVELKLQKIQIEIDFKADKLEDLEYKYDKIKNKIDFKEALGFTASVGNYSNMNKNLMKQIANIEEQNALMEQQKKLVDKGSEAWYEYNQNIQKNNESIRSLTQSMIENAQASAELAGNKASSKTEKYDSADELTDAKIDNTDSYKGKNKLINKKISNIQKRQNAYDNAVTTSQKRLNSSSSAITKLKNKSGKSNKTYNSVLKAVKKAVKSKKLISESLLNKAYALDDNYALWEYCVQYNENLKALNSNKEIAELYAETSQQEKADLAIEKANNIETYYDNRIDRFEQRAQQINDSIDLIEAEGYQAASGYYEKLIELEKEQNGKLVAEKERLVAELNHAVSNGSISVYSDEWFELMTKIDNVTNSISESTATLVEFQNQLRQLKWDNFDRLEDRISNITTEADFMINELSRDDLREDDGKGKLTDSGRAVMGLHASNYLVYISQMRDYEEQLQQINEELANDPSNQTLIERKWELVQAYQEATDAAQDEKYAVIDLAKEGYEGLKNTIDDLISEFLELLDLQKDAYDYQRRISDYTKNITDLRKQLAAYAGDVSEEARAKVQDITVKLNEAEQNLQDAQYDKFISDTKDMLSDLQDDLAQAVQDIVNNLDKNFDELLSDIEKDATILETIKNKMDEIDYVTTENLSSILNSSNIVTGTANVVTAVNNVENAINKLYEEMSKANAEQAAKEELEKQQETVKQGISSNAMSSQSEVYTSKASMSENGAALSKAQIDLDAANQAYNMKSSELQNMLSELQRIQERNRQAEIESAKRNEPVFMEDTTKLESKIAELQVQLDNIVRNKNTAQGAYYDAKSKYDSSVTDYNNSMAKYTAYDYLANHLDSTTLSADELPSKVNQALYKQFSGLILDNGELSELAGKLGTDTNGLYDKLKAIGIPGFKIGSENILKNMLAFLGEGNAEIQFDKSQGVLKQVGEGDMIFNSDMSKNLWKLAQMNPDMLVNHLDLPTINIPSFERNVQSNPVSVEFNGGINVYANDPEEFGRQMRKELCSNSKTAKCITEIVSAKQLGRSGIGKARLYM